MDIYNNGKKTSYEFLDGEYEIFCNFDESLFYADVLLIEFEDLQENELNPYIIYKSINNVEVMFVETSHPFDFYLILKKDIRQQGVGYTKNLIENFRRNKIEIFSKEQITIDNIQYNFGFNKLEVKSGKVKFSKSNINYLEYLCKKFEDAIDIILKESKE